MQSVAQLVEPKFRTKLQYTPELGARLCESVSNGVPLKIAAQTQGLNVSTVLRWRQRGEVAMELLAQDKEVPLYEQQFIPLVESLSRARGQALEERIAQVADAGHTDWRAASWYLERQVPSEFGQVNRTELTGADGGPIQLAQAELASEAEKIVKASMEQRSIESGT